VLHAPGGQNRVILNEPYVEIGTLKRNLFKQSKQQDKFALACWKKLNAEGSNNKKV
jgi:hypothetical protein